MTLRDNSQRSEATRFALILPPEELGSVGFRFVRATVDEKIGEEVLLVLTEAPDYAPRYAVVSALDLEANGGTLDTPNGTIGAIVWHIGAGSPLDAYIEQFLNPSAATLTLLGEAAKQTRLKLVVLDNRTSEVRAFIDYENLFLLDKLVAELEKRSADAKPAEFTDARIWAKQNGNLIAKVRAGTLN